MKNILLASALAASSLAQAAPLYSNGAIVDGAGLSIVASTDNTYGFGASAASGNSLADDFHVGGNGWQVQSLDFYAYQTGISAFQYTSVAWKVISGDVNTGTVMASGTTAVTSGGQVGYRVLPTTLTNTQRPIFDIAADVPDFDLAAGDYWLTWSLSASNANAIFVPSLTALAADNGQQATTASAGQFFTLHDGGSNRTVDLPFQINGMALPGTVPEPGSLALVGLAGFALLACRRRV